MNKIKYNKINMLSILTQTLLLLALYLVSACQTSLLLPESGVEVEADQLRFQHAPHVALRLPCSQCHADMDQASDSREQHLPQKHQVCKKCHSQQCQPDRDSQSGLSGQQRPCLFCHSQPRLARALPRRDHSALIFKHNKHLPRIDEEVQSQACLHCHHQVIDSRAIDDDKLPDMDTCLDCHNHQSDFNEQRCHKCHRDLQQLGLRPLSQFSHQGDFLHDHGPFAQNDPQLCLSCHARRDCESCHDARRINLPSRVDSLNIARPYMHRGNWILRHGGEANRAPVACLRCHQDQACQDCHEAAGLRRSAGRFISPHPRGWALDKGSVNFHGRVAATQIVSCMACHDGDRPGGAGTNCVLCHDNRPGLPGGNPHPPGFRSLLNPYTHPACRDCHRRS